ncbi:hypothetical protein N431DRAFT_529676 [Stipitochalara longipes BDJ]|nr:hypothetical protein N431DRAFT_529676 [Stipitochalara longipes BDJ]
MDATLIDDHLEIAQQHFRSVLCHCKNMDGELLRRKVIKHNAEMLIIAGGMFPQHPTPSSSPHNRRSRARTRNSSPTPSFSSLRSASPVSPRSRKRKQDHGNSKKRKKLFSRGELNGEAGPAQMTVEPIDKPERGTSLRVITTNIFGKVNSKIPPVSKPIVEIPSKKQPATVDLTNLDDSDDDLAGNEPKPGQIGLSITVGEVSKNFLDVQAALEESLFVERDSNGLTREEKERERMRGRRASDGLGGPMRETIEVDEDILAGFEGGREGERGDREMEMEIMYADEEGGEVMHEGEEQGEGEVEAEAENLPKRCRSV